MTDERDDPAPLLPRVVPWRLLRRSKGETSIPGTGKRSGCKLIKVSRGIESVKGERTVRLSSWFHLGRHQGNPLFGGYPGNQTTSVFGKADWLDPRTIERHQPCVSGAQTNPHVGDQVALCNDRVSMRSGRHSRAGEQAPSLALMQWPH